MPQISRRSPPPPGTRSAAKRTGLRCERASWSASQKNLGAQGPSLRSEFRDFCATSDQVVGPSTTKNSADLAAIDRALLAVATDPATWFAKHLDSNQNVLPHPRVETAPTRPLVATPPASPRNLPPQEASRWRCVGRNSPRNSWLLRPHRLLPS
jgi:hypothetical protein